MQFHARPKSLFFQKKEKGQLVDPNVMGYLTVIRKLGIGLLTLYHLELERSPYHRSLRMTADRRCCTVDLQPTLQYKLHTFLIASRFHMKND